MKVTIVAFALLGSAGCVRAAETNVREQAASAFSCADYALTVTEVGPDVYRASGCGQELIYACEPVRPAPQEEGAEGVAHKSTAVSCTRTLE